MEVTDIFSSSFSSAATNAANASEASNTINREDFLTLLVTQLQNQDPLNPMESAEFSSQLAQFSSLEQLIQINDGIEALAGGGNQNGSVDALSLLGRQVRAASGEIDVAGGEHSELSFELSSAGAVEVEVSSGGVSFGTFSIGERAAGTHALDLSELDGLPPLSDGTYSITVHQIAEGGLAETVPTFVLGQVTGVELTDGESQLVLGNRRVALSDVREVRASVESVPEPSADEESSDA